MMMLRGLATTVMAAISLVLGAPPANTPATMAHVPPTASFASKVITKIPDVIVSPWTWVPVAIYAVFLVALAVAVLRAERRTKEAFNSGNLIERRQDRSRGVVSGKLRQGNKS